MLILLTFKPPVYSVDILNIYVTFV
jgi:hypothetical protein